MVERNLPTSTRERDSTTDRAQQDPEDQRSLPLPGALCGRPYPRATPGVPQDDDRGPARLLDYWQAAGVYLSRAPIVHICGVWLHLFCAGHLLQISAIRGPRLQNPQVPMRRL